MIKVYLTTGHCNPPMTRTIPCDEVRYVENKHKVSMYDKHGKTNKLVAWAITDEWLHIVIEYNDGHKEVIK